MPENHLYEYAVIRIVPRMEREEFFNAGVIVFCKKKNFLRVLLTLNENKLFALDAKANSSEIQAYLNAFEKVAAGDKRAGPIAQLDTASRFRWLTATRSTIIQSSKIHPGFCNDIEQKARQLFEQFVL